MGTIFHGSVGAILEVVVVVSEMSVNGQLLNISQVLTVEGVTRLEDNESASCPLNDVVWCVLFGSLQI